MSTSNNGNLIVSVTTATNHFPVANATVNIAYTADPDSLILTETTDSSGNTPSLTLPAPPVSYSEEPSANQPYSEYTISISAEGYEPIVISGSEIFPEVTALQNTELIPHISVEIPPSAELFVIPPHTLYGDYPPKIVEAEVKPVSASGEIVLSSVVIPEFVIVHDGVPTNQNAQNYYVRYRDYIKNVASSEVYATWPRETLIANIIAIQSFTLNRVYTEWYRSRGYSFTITSSTAYDHKWIPERNIYDNISTLVDEYFHSYLSRPNVRQPILAQYCDGQRVTCPNLMSQWGSKALGDQGYSALDILKYYYGDSIYINQSEEISGVPSSYGGELLRLGSSGAQVRTIQEQLNAISRAYPAIPAITVDGIFGPATEAAVRKFQEIFGLTQDGVVGFATWYRISSIYVAISRIAEYTPE